MAIGIAAVVMMVVMCGGMLLLGHQAHKHHEEGKQDTHQETSVKGSTVPATGRFDAEKEQQDHQHH